MPPNASVTAARALQSRRHGYATGAKDDCVCLCPWHSRNHILIGRHNTSAQRAWSDNNAMDYADDVTRAANVYKPQDNQPNDCDKGFPMTPGLRTEGTPGDRRIAEPSDALAGHRGSDDTEMKPADYSTSPSPENGADQVEGTADADMTHEDDVSEGSDGSVSTGDDEESPLENLSTNICVSMVPALFL